MSSDGFSLAGRLVAPPTAEEQAARERKATKSRQMQEKLDTIPLASSYSFKAYADLFGPGISLISISFKSSGREFTGIKFTESDGTAVYHGTSAGSELLDQVKSALTQAGGRRKKLRKTRKGRKGSKKTHRRHR